MAIDTFSAFYFGIKINSLNQNLNFDEGSGELTAQIEPGSYSLTDFLVAIQTALESASVLPQAYTVTADRITRQITITAANTFDLLISTGSQTGTSPWTLIGFNGIVDLTGLLTYTGASGSGEEYITQFPLQDYVLADHFQDRIDASVNESASGKVEVISYGVRKLFIMSFKYITNKAQDGHVIRNNPNGVANAVNFFENITERGEFEFMPDAGSRSTFFKVQIEKTTSQSKGTGFKLKELTGQNLPDYFEITNVNMRLVE